MNSTLKALVASAMERHATYGLYETPVPGLVLMSSTHEKLPRHMIYRPALCVIVQGAKQLVLGSQVFDYGEMQCLVISVDLPAAGRVSQASVAEPYYGINLDLDAGVMRSVLEELKQKPVPRGETGPGLFVGEMTEALGDCVTRLVRLLDTPVAIPVLAPAIMREICFWLLTGPYGGEVCKVALPDSHMRRIADALYLLRERYAETLRMEALAAAARMSPSSFYQHFKALTAMTPLQYQKQLRLLEARRLMLAADVNVTEAAYRVGYESASQFSRDYARMFGTAPKRDVTGLRASPVGQEIVVGAG